MSLAHKILIAAAAFLLAPQHTSAASVTCEPTWYSARLTNYTSYPDPGSEECVAYNGCTWAGQFYGLPDQKMSPSWVQSHNIAAVHLKDWPWLKLKILKLRQGSKKIDVRVIDVCADEDCDGCCTQNLRGKDHLIDIEKYTMERFGAGDGEVEFQVCQ